jgi:hypothetical protein
MIVDEVGYPEWGWWVTCFATGGGSDSVFPGVVGLEVFVDAAVEGVEWCLWGAKISLGVAGAPCEAFR